MKKIFTFNLLFFAFIFSLNAQAVLERVISTTGGTFLGDGNTVGLVSHDYDENETTEIATFLGDFSNDIAIEGKWGYVHVGRGFGNPAGMDAVYKVDLTNGEIVDSLVNIPGITHLAVEGNMLVVAKGFGATGSNLVFYDKNDLNSSLILFEDPNIPNTIGAMLKVGVNLLVGYNEDGIGKLAYYNLSGGLPELSQTLDVGSNMRGLNDMVTDGNFVYMLSEYVEYDDDFNVIFSLSAVSKLSIQWETYETQTYDSASGGLVVTPTPFGDMLIGDFGADGNLVNADNLLPLGQNFLPSYTAGIADGVNQVLWIQETDYFSFGKVSGYSAQGSIIREFDTDISGSAIDLVFNNPPNAMNDEYQASQFTDNYAILSNDIDADIHELKLDVISDVEGGNVTINPDNTIEATFDDGSSLITFSYIMSDIWNSPAMGFVTIDFVSDVNEIFTPVSIFAYPNPTIDVVSLDLQEFDNQDVEIIVRSIAGRVVVTSNIENTTVYNLDLSSFSRGVYFVELVGDGKKGNLKVVKQ